MEVMFEREDGRRGTAVVLAAQRHMLRVVVPGIAETAEWMRTDGEWRDELGQRIDIEALLSVGEMDCNRFCAEVWPVAIGAGGRLS